MTGGTRWKNAPIGLRTAPHAVLAAACCGLVLPLWAVPPRALLTVCLLVFAAAAAWAIRRARPALAIVAVVGCAFFGAAVWGAAQLARTSPPELSLPAATHGIVALDAPALPVGAGWRVRAVAEELVSDGRQVPPGTRLFLDLEDDERPEAGRRVRVQGRLLDAAGAGAPAWWRRYVERQGVAARLRVRIADDLGARRGIHGLRERWRGWARSAVAGSLAGDRGALLRGLALGGGSELSEEAAEAFRTSGLWHLLAVSGQNVTVVAVATLTLLRGLGVAGRGAILGAAAGLAAYCLAADGGASVGRAAAVGALGLVAELRPGPRERWYVLLVGLVALLAAQPRSLHDPGLQLSFAAVAGITALAPSIERALAAWLPGPAARPAAAAAAAGVATAPVLAWHFGTVSLAGLVANVVAVPLAGPVVLAALAGALLGAVAPPAGAALTGAAGVGAEAMLMVARLAALPPGASVSVPRATAPAMLAAGAAWAALARFRGGRLAPHRVVRRRPVSAALAVAIPAAILIAAHRPAPPAAWPGRADLVVLDVGQGQAVLLRGGGGAAVLIDVGPPGDPAPVVDALRRFGVRRLDAVAVTHPALDHVGGMSDLVDRLPIGRLIVPPRPRGAPHGPTTEAIAAAAGSGAAIVRTRAGDVLTAGRWRLEVLWPERRLPAGVDPNRGSLVVRATADGWSALLAGDAESPTLAPLATGSVDALVVGHHGSADAGLGAFLARLRPRVGAVSAGAGNRFGHPAPSTLRTLRRAGVRVARTDRHGDLIVRRARAGVDVAPSR